MGQVDPNVSFRLPSDMRQVMALMTRCEDFSDASDVMRRALTDKLYWFVGKTLVHALSWDGVLRLVHDCHLPRRPEPLPVKNGGKSSG